MPVQDFALDPAATHRVQVHWVSDTEPATVMVNRSILGSLSTVAERMTGKNFTLPDGSMLHVRFANGQPQAFRNSYPLVIAPAIPETSVLQKKLGGCLTTWLVVMLIGGGWSIITNFLQFSGVTKTHFFQPSPVFLLLAVLLNGAQIVSVIALFAWKRWGFYLFISLVLCNLGIYYLEHTNDNYPFPSVALTTLSFTVPFIGIGILYWLLRRNQVWEQLA